MTRFSENYIPLTNTPLVGNLVHTLLSDPERLAPFTSTKPELESLMDYSIRRKDFATDRQVLVKVLREQYLELTNAGESIHKDVHDNITALESSDVFTVTTGHQLQLAGGPLFFTYKILSAVKLSSQLNIASNRKFTVPVLWLATEDHDMEEIRHVELNGKQHRWETGWRGAAGRCSGDGLSRFVNELVSSLGTELPGMELAKHLRESYVDGRSYSLASRIFYNRIYGKYGLVMLDPDHAGLKQQMKKVFEEDLVQHTPELSVNETISKLKAIDDPQAKPRNINLFYLLEDSRRRIEQHQDQWSVVDSSIVFSKSQLTDELHHHPERLSPNVILRPLYQETVLPNLAYIGGPGEMAYWLELKSMFDHFSIPYPALILRNNFLILGSNDSRKMEQANIDDASLFAGVDAWIRTSLRADQPDEDPLSSAENEMDRIYTKVIHHLESIDPTLKASAEGELQKVKKGLAALREKRFRAEKRREETTLARINRLHEVVFPGGTFQERKTSFLSMYLKFGSGITDELLEHCSPFNSSLSILREKESQIA